MEGGCRYLDFQVINMAWVVKNLRDGKYNDYEQFLNALLLLPLDIPLWEEGFRSAKLEWLILYQALAQRICEGRKGKQLAWDEEVVCHCTKCLPIW